MSRRFLAALAAMVLAAISGVLVLTYVRSADERAIAGQEPRTVLVVVGIIAEGTPADQISELVTPQTFPTSAVVPGALTNLDSVAGMVATTDLQLGEQVLASRFSDPATLGVPGEVEIPAGMQQVSVALDAQRALGGNLVAGQTVGVFISFGTPTTHLVLHQVLVTRVQGGVAAPDPVPTGEVAETPVAEPAAGGSVMVTVALSAADAEILVFAAEHATIWLSLENPDSSADGTRIVIPETVYE